MTILRVDNFGGMIPRVSDKALPVNAAVNAINCDLRGGQINSFPTFGTVVTLGARGAVGNGTKYLEQIPSLVAAVTNSIAPAYVQFAPPLGNYIVAAGDELWYAVYIPSVPATNPVTGIGNIDLTFTDATTLGAGVVDQNAISATAGNLVTQANGKWYARKIPISGMLASDGTAITGKTINGVRLYMNNSDAHPVLAYYGPVFIVNASTTYKGALLDIDLQQDPSSIGTKGFDYQLIDEDDLVMDGFMAAVYPTGNSSSMHSAMMFRLARVPFGGYQRNKHLVATTYLRGLDLPVNVGRSNHDNFAPMFDAANPTLDYSILNDFAWRQNGLYGASVQINFGWVGVTKPTTAMSVSLISGGVGATVDRSYVFTHVSEDGLESAPSPALGPTSGKVDDTWTLNVPTWNGTDNFCKSTPAGSLRHKRRVYRTSAGDSVYKLVGELDDNDTTIADTVLDANLGAELATTAYQDPPIMQDVTYWKNGIAACITQGNTVAFCVPYGYHAWPLTQRYTMHHDALRVVSLGERLLVLTKGRPEVIFGDDPADLDPVQLPDGEPCINADSVHETPGGIVYAGRTGWGRISVGGGYENITAAFFKPSQFYSALDSSGYMGVGFGASKLISAFDGERLVWGSQGTATGYMLDLNEGKLVRYEFPQTIYALSYYQPRNALWAAYNSGSNRAAAKVFGAAGTLATDRLKWTWKSKLMRSAAPVSFEVAQIESTEWDSLSANMKGREAALATVPPGTPYSITTTGTTQSELWCRLKVWAEADKGADTVVVYDDFVVSDEPIVMLRDILSDSWQFEITGNINVVSVSLAETAKELRQE